MLLIRSIFLRESTAAEVTMFVELAPTVVLGLSDFSVTSQDPGSLVSF